MKKNKKEKRNRDDDWEMKDTKEEVREDECNRIEETTTRICDYKTKCDWLLY